MNRVSGGSVKRKGGLGRGIDYLLSSTAAGGVERLEEVPVEHIQRGQYQPRLRMDPEALRELADSIRVQGIVQPVVVRRQGDNYELIAGERRWRAAQMAGLATIPTVIRDLPDQAAAAMALIENIQREDLSPLEEAQAIRRLIGDFELTHQDAAVAVGRSRVAVTNLLRLLELDERVQEKLNAGELEMGHARCLLSLAPDLQLQASDMIVQRRLSVREAEKLVQRLRSGKGTPTPRVGTTLPEVRQLEDRLADTLGAPVQIRYNRAGKGRLVIEYNSLDELDGILAHIQ
jgi:ParB family chromosome partitioning protein